MGEHPPSWPAARSTSARASPTWSRPVGSSRDRRHAFRCVIVGDGPQRARLAAQIAAAGLDDRVILAGAAPHTEVVRHYRDGDVFVLPCLERPVKLRDPEADLMKSLEAWFEPSGASFETASRMCWPKPWPRGARGHHADFRIRAGAPRLQRSSVPPGNPAQLAEVLETLLTDRALRRQLGMQAAADVRAHFDRGRHVASLVRIFQDHLDNGHGPAPTAAAMAESRV